MPQADTLALIAIGFTVFLGALQMKPHYRFIPVLLGGGWVVIVWGVVKLVWNSDALTWLIAGIAVAGLTAIAIVSVVETNRSANVQSYIRIWERNFENWDSGRPNSRADLTETHEGEMITPVVIRLPIQKCPAKFTPVFQTLYDTIEEGACAWLTINGNGLQFENNQLGEWRPVLSDTSHVGQFVGYIDNPIFPGKSKVGPDGVIKVHFPVGDYRVGYKIEGESRKGCAFSKEGYFVVQIYDQALSSKPAFPSNDRT